METFELRYFLAAAAHQNLSKAAKQASVSVPAISRAISRLEEELGSQLFVRVGRNIQLSPAGKKLQQDASRVIGLIEDIKGQFRPSQNAIPISICGTEFGISMYLPEVIRRLKASGTEFTFDVRVFPTSKRVRQAIADGEAQLGVVSGNLKFPGFSTLSLGKFESKTLVGKGHPLFKSAKDGREIRIDEVLQHEFVSFTEVLLGGKQSDQDLQDGWRDDKFKRRIGMKTESIEVALRLVESGNYLGYLPLELASSRPSIAGIITSGCPYSCETKCWLLALGENEYSWLSRLFKS